MKKYIISFIWIFVTITVFSQYQNPSSIKWRQIKTDHFNVVFPSEVKERGIEMARILETAYKPTRNSLRTATPKTSVFLYNQSVISNGYTALAPYQIVFYATPPQDASLVGGIDWLQTLTVHEYRHAVQYEKLNNRFTYFMGSLFGDYGRAVFMDFSVPLWVFEGDAVCTETAFSLEGRGRLPSFTRDIRALELDDTRYSYYKAYLGSYKDYFPNHYHLGYLMTAHIRNNYGDDVWNKTLTRSTTFSFWPWTFSRSLKKYTRFSMRKTYNNCLNEFDSIWTENLQRLETSRFDNIFLPPKKVYTNYSFPFYIDENRIVAKKTGMADVPQLVLLEDGSEKKLAEINPIDRIHSNGELVVWSIETASIRWSERSYSNIEVYNLKDNSKKIITRKGKYYAPAISPDGSMIAAVKYNQDMKCRLILLDSKTGKEIKSFDFPDDSFIRMPSWSANGKKIVFTVSKGQERNISVLDLNTNHIESIIELTTESITNPIFYKDYVLYNSPVSGIDGIYAINLSTKERYNVISDQYGAYNPSFSEKGKKLVFQNYTSMGNNLGTIEADSGKWRKVKKIENIGDNYYQHVVELEKGSSIFDSLSDGSFTEYEIKKYRPLFHSIQIHSWAPYTVNNGVGFGVLSNDKLNTTSIMAGINYFPDVTAHREFINFTYSRFFPVLELMASYGRQYNVEEDTSGSTDYRPWDEKLFRAGVMLPFNFSRGIHTTIFELNMAYNSIYYNLPKDGYFADSLEAKDEVTALEYSLKFQHYRQMAIRDINPRFGQSLSIMYWNTPFDKGTNGERFVSTANLYLPGFLKHHNIALKGAYEKSSPNFREGIYSLTTSSEFIRGYARNNSEVFKKGTLEYTFPLGYPDLALGPILYCKRVSANLFYDYGQLDWENEQYTFSSVGLDLNFNLNFFSFIIPLEMGLRTSYLIEDKEFAFEFIFFNTAF
jgi:hypothetical protein